MADAELAEINTGAGINVPGSLTNAFVPSNALPAPKPSEGVLLIAQMTKAIGDIPADQKDLKALALEELKFFKMAAAIIANRGADNKEYFDSVRVQFGNGLDGVYKLAEYLREIARQKMANVAIQKVTSTAKVDGVTKVSKEFADSKNPFSF